MKNYIKFALVLTIAGAVAGCNDEEDKRQAQLQQQQYNQQQQQQMQQQEPQYINQAPPSQPVIINNQQPSSSGADTLLGFVAGAAVGHAIGNSNSRSYNNDRYYGSNQKTYKTKTTIVNNNTYITTQPKKSTLNTSKSYYGSTPSKSTSSFSTSKPKSKYSNVFSRSKKR